MRVVDVVDCRFNGFHECARGKTGMLASSSTSPLVYGGNRSVTGVQGGTKTNTPNILICTQHFPLDLQIMPVLMENSFLLVGRKDATLLLVADYIMNLLEIFWLLRIGAVPLNRGRTVQDHDPVLSRSISFKWVIYCPVPFHFF